MMDMKKAPTAGRKKCGKKHLGGSVARTGVLVALLATAGALWWYGAQLPDHKPRGVTPTTQASVPTPAPTGGRNAREAAYDKDIATLTALVESERTDAETRAHAAGRLENMVRDHQSELGVEAALIQAGFHPCLVLLQNDALTVMIDPAEELTATQSATILSVCVAHTEVAAENVRIMAGE